MKNKASIFVDLRKHCFYNNIMETRKKVHGNYKSLAKKHIRRYCRILYDKTTVEYFANISRWCEKYGNHPSFLFRRLREGSFYCFNGNDGKIHEVVYVWCVMGFEENSLTWIPKPKVTWVNQASIITAYTNKWRKDERI